PERAEFIRAQIELARMDEDDARRPGLLTRETALWKKHSKTWKAELPKLLQTAPFRRGFPAPPGHHRLEVPPDDRGRLRRRPAVGLPHQQRREAPRTRARERPDDPDRDSGDSGRGNQEARAARDREVQEHGRPANRRELDRASRD